MEIITWNVNGIRAIAKKGFHSALEKLSPDFFCIQEVKANEEQFVKDVGDFAGYKSLLNCAIRPGYAGTALFYKEDLKIIGTKTKFGDLILDEDGRITEIEFEYNGKKTLLLNIYFPNGGTRSNGKEMLSYKLNFYDKIIAYSNNQVKKGKNIIITGDFNICHEEIDIARPKENNNSIGFLPIERAKISEFLDNGYIDTFREKYPDRIDIYSWWSYRTMARPRNVGWRLDCFLVNKEFYNSVIDTIYLNEIMGSDHCPVLLKLK